MIIVGDIGNTETKICIINDRLKKIKKFSLNSKKIEIKKLNYHFKNYNFNKTKKILFCSVVPSTFKSLKKFFLSKTKVKCHELKELNLNSLIKIDVNFKQVGSDRLANAISVSDEKKTSSF